MKTIVALLLSASTVFAQTQPQPQPKPDIAEGQQTPPSKTTPAVATPSTNQPVEFNTQPLRWRSIGPANMGGRIADFAVVEKDPYTIYVAVGTGGVLKTTNNGSTWQGVFDKEPVASTGSVAVSQNNPKIVWVGTGEGNSRNSSSWGNGVYKSTDGGDTWTNMGLPE
ncbi:MAG TPA: sialidase family protein, partial [Thermoanaerobaculia bacterium]|nr:sialidase family protein [Thermoanaerobaculia bacterium]